MFELNKACREALGSSSLSCQHGIGHGIAVAVGYERDQLDKALAVCEGLPFSDAIGGCYGGVLMEYNVRTMGGERGVPRENTGPLEPCVSLRDPFATACYFWQAQWWGQQIFQGISSPDTFAKMGAFCIGLPIEAHRRSCFQGIGNIAAHGGGFTAMGVRELCGAVSSLARYKLLCVAVAANHLGIETTDTEAKKACLDFSDDEAIYCLAWAENKSNVAGSVPLP